MDCKEEAILCESMYLQQGELFVSEAVASKQKQCK